MSGLEKFQANETWRNKFRNFLFMERKPEIVQQHTTITESERYSLDIAEDLKSIIERKKNQKTAQIHTREDIANTSKMSNESDDHSKAEVVKKINHYDESAYGNPPMGQNTPNESFEALEKMCDKTASDPNSTLFNYLNANVEQKNNNTRMWQKTSDESFEALERMCDKTASDPNSTLFKYLHTDRKEEILAEVKKRSTDGQSSTDQDPEDQLLRKINNCTLLDDIEAPSRMWENTICGDTILQTSPVKMVGLLRPSTIIEETPDDSANSDISSQLSFRTATKNAQSDVSSSVYDTANDYTADSSKTNLSNKFKIEESKRINADQGLLVNLDKVEDANYPCFDTLNNTMVERATLSSQSDQVSTDLIDLEKTFGPVCYPSQVLSINDSSSGNEDEQDFENLLDESVIELISDDEYDNVELTSKIDVYASSIKSEVTSSITGESNDSYSFNRTKEDDKENCLESQEHLQKSMQFNDTMEEVEYMLKRGMEYMAAEAAAKDTPQKVGVPLSSFNINEAKTQPNSSLKHLDSVKPTSSFSASKAKLSTYTTPAKTTPLPKASGSASKRFDMDIKPFPKLDIFAKPLAQTRSKELASKQQKFSHIISPIGTYMKKTAQTPLMSSINCKTKDYFNSTAIMELENESRLYKPQFQTNSHDEEAVGHPQLPGLISEAKRPLPKKAYISSDLKHIVDERTPITIPASKKIQKYLENAMMPAVLRHEGKFKVPGGVSNKFNTLTTSSAAPSKIPLKESDTNSGNSKTTASYKPHRNNASLADLSIMSGDISMYTIMDAQKF